MGEYGSVVIVSSNVPFKDLIAPVLIFQRLEQYDYAGATVIGTVLLAISLLILLAINLLQAWGRRYDFNLGQSFHPEVPATESSRPQKERRWVKPVLIGIAITYLALVLFIPAINVFFQAFKQGVGPFLTNLTEPAFTHAVQLTLLIALIVVPLNTVFGLCAAWAITRHQFRGRAFVISILDLPFAVSPVVAGLMIVLLYGRNGWFGPLLQSADIKIVFALPGMILATAFVTMPFVAREVIPVLEEAGTEQEEAAKTLGASNWQIFWRVTVACWSRISHARTKGNFATKTRIEDVE